MYVLAEVYVDEETLMRNYNYDEYLSVYDQKIIISDYISDEYGIDLEVACIL